MLWKKMSVFHEDVAIESNNETLEDNDKWLLFEDNNGLDSDDEETNDSDFESDEDIGRRVEQSVNRFEIHNDSNLSAWERIETNED